MPYFRIDTNVPASEISPTFLTELGSLIAEILPRPESFVAGTLAADQRMVFGGTEERCAILHLEAVVKLGPKKNLAITKPLFEKMTAGLGVSPTRMYIHFREEVSWNIAYNGTTFLEIMGE